MIEKNEHKCKFVPRLDGYDHCECGKKVQVYDPVQQKHIDQRLETAINAYGSLRERYLKLLEFVKKTSSCELMNNTQDEPATELLKEIGEL